MVSYQLKVKIKTSGTYLEKFCIYNVFELYDDRLQLQY